MNATAPIDPCETILRKFETWFHEPDITDSEYTEYINFDDSELKTSKLIWSTSRIHIDMVIYQIIINI